MVVIAMSDLNSNLLEIKRHMFSVRLATELNVLSSVVFQTLIFWIHHNENTNTNYYNSYHWTYLSLSNFVKMFPYATKMQIRTALSNLEESGYILSRIDEDDKEHPKYYTITDKGRFFHNSIEGTDNEFHTFNISFACKYGIIPAILFENIYRWIQHNQLLDDYFKDGLYWTYSTKKSLLNYFPYISKPTMQKHFKILEDAEILKIERVETFSIKGSWYAITEKGTSIYMGTPYDESKEITHESKKITHESKEITHESKEITHESKKITHHIKDKSIKINLKDEYLSSNLTANEDLRFEMPLPLNSRIVGMCRKALNRDFSYSEKQIILDLIEKQTPIEVVELAIRDNEFRGSALSVAHIAVSIETWANAGCTTPTEIERYILVNHSRNIERKFGADSQVAAKTTEIQCREAVKDIEHAYAHQQYQQMRLAYDTAIDSGLPIDKYLSERVRTTLVTVSKKAHKVDGSSRMWLEFVNATLTRIFANGDLDSLRDKYNSFVSSRPDESINLEDFVSEEILSAIKAS